MGSESNGLTVPAAGASAILMPRLSAVADQAAAVTAMGLLVAVVLGPWVVQSTAAPEPVETAVEAAPPAAAEKGDTWKREIRFDFYAGGPIYHRSDVRLQRPDGTDLTLKGLGWDGDMFYFPIDGGVRSVEYWGAFGFMIDFLHNKAISRLGKGSHGRRAAGFVVEDADVKGTLKGELVDKRVKLTEIFERLEFTHGHNTLIFTPLIRAASITPSVRPYFGIGAGFAIPHVEVWFPGDDKSKRTNEYQYSGPAWQFLAGIEYRIGRASYFIEYKFMQAWIDAALTGDESWKNWNMFGDLGRQFERWRTGREPEFGRLSTVLSNHTVVGGGGYWTRWGKKAAP